MALKGHTPWNKGKTDVYSDKHMQFLREKNVGNIISEETKKRLVFLRKGHQLGTKGFLLAKK